MKYKVGTVLSFEDTDTEYVNVGVGMMPVAQMKYNNLVIVRRWGRGYRLEKVDHGSETFGLPCNWNLKIKTKQYISLKQFIEQFGTLDELKYVCEEWELDPTEEQIAQMEKEIEAAGESEDIADAFDKLFKNE